MEFERAEPTDFHLAAWRAAPWESSTVAQRADPKVLPWAALKAVSKAVLRAVL
jgi:hypothetical protein